VIQTTTRDLNGRILESEAESREWAEVGGYALPAKFVVARAETLSGPRERGGADAGWQSLTLTFAEAELLGKPAVKGTASFPGFRGDGTGRSAAKDLPQKWSPKAVTWQAKLPGYGQSSPVVHGGKVFVTAVEGPNKEKNLVASYDTASGKELWKKELPATQKVKSSPFVSRAAPTPVVDDTALYVFFESGELAALALKDGERLWLRSLVKDYGTFKNNHGIGPSLAQTADTVFVLIDHQGPSYLLAVGKKDGKNRWKKDRKSRVSWTSPVVAGEKGKERLVVSSGGTVDVYDCASGELLSSYKDIGNNSVPSAVVQGDRVVIGAADPPRDADREVTLKSCCCLTLGADGKLSGKPLWQSKRATASFASPLVHDGHVYYVNAAGVAFCLDLKTGEERYSQRLPGPCWASPVGAGDRVYFFGKDGVTTVVKAGPKYVKLATNRLWEGAGPKAAEEKPIEMKKENLKGVPPQFAGPAVYGAALIDGAIFLRTGTTLYAVRAGK
jgi:outer membrane protein assembly factor BamB